jgi:hypothetical protein
MLIESLIAAALLHTGGVAVNDNPSDYLEGVSGCSAYETSLERESCVGRVHFAWTGEVPAMDVNGVEVPTTAYQAPSEVFTQEKNSSPLERRLSPGAVAPIDTGIEVPVVSGNASTGDNGEWVAPEWCELTKSADYSGPIEHESGDDWSIVTENWSDEEVALCF